jgi:prevent-host-death family protein
VLAIRYNLDSLDRIEAIQRHAWQLQEAKNKLSELIDRVLAEGPQVITRHGVEVVVVMPFSEFRKLTTPAQRLGDFFTASPLRAGDVQIERDPDIVLRDIDL